MTFEEFIATRRPSSDLGAALDDAYWEDLDEPATGFIYVNELWIEKSKDGVFLLTLGREVYIDDLPKLEQKLYAFALSEDIIEPPAE